MQLFVLGINHRSAPVEIREKFAVASERQGDFLAKASRLPHVQEVLLLSTCNRVEIYGVSNHASLAAQQLGRFLCEFQGLEPNLLETHSYFRHGDEAILHGFQVAGSLDSMILGEPQILGQVKEAYRLANDAATTGILLNKFFHKAFHAAKRIRTETAIGQSPVSVSYTAVLLGRQIFGELEDKKVLILGAGEMSEAAIRHFRKAGIKSLFIANRSLGKAEELAREVGGEIIPFEKFEKWLIDADIVLASTSAPQYLIAPEMVQEAMRHRGNRPIFFIDIAVPRNVAPGVNGLPNVYLYDIDDLGAVVEANKDGRLREAERAEGMLEKEASEFSRYLQTRKVAPTISSLSRKFDTICQRELEKVLQKMPELDAAGREAVERMAYAIANKILHDPMVTLKEEDSEREQLDSANFIRKLFRLDEF